MCNPRAACLYRESYIPRKSSYMTELLDQLLECLKMQLPCKYTYFLQLSESSGESAYNGGGGGGTGTGKPQNFNYPQIEMTAHFAERLCPLFSQPYARYTQHKTAHKHPFQVYKHTVDKKRRARSSLSVFTKHRAHGQNRQQLRAEQMNRCLCARIINTH